MRVLRNPELNDPGNQVEWERLIQRKLHSALRTLVRLQLFFKIFNPAGSGIKTDVILERSKMHQVAVKVKGGHLVTDLFGCIRGSCVDHRTQFLQPALDILGHSGNIIINGRDFTHSNIHDHSYSPGLTGSGE
jgi:hypothetical protein